MLSLFPPLFPPSSLPFLIPSLQRANHDSNAPHSTNALGNGAKGKGHGKGSTTGRLSPRSHRCPGLSPGAGVVSVPAGRGMTTKQHPSLPEVLFYRQCHHTACQAFISSHSQWQIPSGTEQWESGGAIPAGFCGQSSPPGPAGSTVMPLLRKASVIPERGPGFPWVIFSDLHCLWCLRSGEGLSSHCQPQNCCWKQGLGALTK